MRPRHTTPLPAPRTTSSGVWTRRGSRRPGIVRQAPTAAGRWNNTGVRAVYGALDPATTILEVAVHNTPRAQRRTPGPDRVPRRRSRRRPGGGTGRSAQIQLASVRPSQHRATGLRGRAAGAHPFVVLPSAISTHNWNLSFVARSTPGRIRRRPSLSRRRCSARRASRVRPHTWPGWGAPAARRVSPGSRRPTGSRASRGGVSLKGRG
ncbi:RES family NAD+ phosphorylase [Phenylobacterium sp.]|uniref:RES family NAD+ phosphorylase n=1 Tax=Phenylobacterium sp. TaxID=1871053 RepID=UPI001220E242|nr:MAG: RES domain-containing protein [Phenylobacterium sp.]